MAENLNVKINPSFGKVGKAFDEIVKGFKLQEELEKFSFEIEAQSKKVTPVDTGRLRSSISTNIKKLSAIVGPHTDYALYVHQGHRTRGGGYVMGRPFMKTGFEVAKTKRYGFQVPFQAHIEAVIDGKIRSL